MRQAWFAICCFVLVACEQDASPEAASGTSRDLPPDAMSTTAYRPDDRRRGELLSFACQACHSLGAGEDHLVGPNLHGVFGRPAGSAPGFENYSRALRGSGLVWSAVELDRWLANPAGFLPGTTMAFTGYQSAADRSALIAFLQEATARDPQGRD